MYVQLEIAGRTFSWGAAPMHRARRLHHPVFLYRAAQPAREKRHSQLLRMQSIESNLLTSSIACESERGAHLWRETKWVACQQSTRWRHQVLRREHDAGCVRRRTLAAKAAIAAELWGTHDRFGWSWACLQLIASFLVWAPHNSCSTGFVEIPRLRWPFTERSNQLVLFFYFWLQLTFPHISQIAFWHKSQGNICGDLFCSCREGKKE